jgi:restriction system protein
LIIVPVNRAILLARATGIKSFSLDVPYGENRVGAEFLRNPDGSLKRVPRDDLSNALETRLKIRMAIAPLDEFAEELGGLYAKLEKGGHSSISSQYEAQNNDLVVEAKNELLKRIQKGGTYLASGGEGFERLVMELLELEGYSVHRPSKNHYAGIADADIEAYRQDRFTQTKLLIQVKHHQGTTDAHGVKQLAAIEEEGAQRWLITSALFEDDTKTYAESHDVQIMDGTEFVDWLFDQAHRLKITTRSRLGLSDAPVLV